ncbi:MAG: EamA family transporter [Kofleriaceae bacterium]
MTGGSTKGIGLALISSASFSTSGAFARSLAGAHWSPAAVVVARCLLAAVFLAIPAYRELRGRWWILRKNSALIVAYGSIPIAACQLSYFNAVGHLAVGIALLLEYLGIVLVVGYLWLKGQRPRRLTVIGSIVALIGLAFVIDLFGSHRFDMIGLAWGLVAAVGLAVFFILSSQEGEGLPPSVLACGGALVGGTLILVVGLLGIAPLHATTEQVVLAGQATIWAVPVVGLAAISFAIPYVVGIRATRMLGPKLSSFISLTEVIFATLFAWAMLGELPTAIQLVGALIIVAGVTLVRLDELGQTERSPTAREGAAAECEARAGRNKKPRGWAYESRARSASAE